MANRDLDFSPQVTQVTPQLPQDSYLTAGAEVADQIATASASAKAMSASMQTSLQFRLLDQKYREQAASNPNDPQALSDLQQGRAAVVSKMGKDVPSIAMRDYQEQAIALQKSSDASNTLWGTRQLVSNTRADVNTGYSSGLQQASMDGAQFASSGSPATEIEGALHYAQLSQQMHQFADPIIGADKAGLLLKNFQQDYTKTFVSSVAEKNPQMANALLEQDGITKHFTPQEIDDMQALIQRTTKAQQLIKSGQQTKADGDLNGLVNDPDKTYYEKRAAIDSMDMNGDVSPKAASAARRVIKSSEDLNTQTDTPTMAGILNQAYDLNADAKINPSDYLVGVQNLHQQILEKQASGDLTAEDATKITRQVTQLMSAKEADATTNVGNSFYSANQKFNALPPEYRGDATRQLFYASQGQSMTDTQLNNQAGAIIDKINQQRVANMKKIVAKVGDDTAFLKTLGYTDAQVQEAAKNRGITSAQVIQALRSKYAKNPTRPTPITGRQRDDAEGEPADTGRPAGPSAVEPEDNYDETRDEK